MSGERTENFETHIHFIAEASVLRLTEILKSLRT